MSKIKNIKSREIIDSRGTPTVEVDVLLEDDSFGRASVPSGASTGKMEAFELRDGDKNRFFGKGVLKAVHNVESHIKSALVGLNAFDQTQIDQLLIQIDGTENKSFLGANAILATSMAVVRAAAISNKVPLFRYLENFTNQTSKYLPCPMMNILNGGAHANNALDIQEFMIMPVKAHSFKDAVRIGCEILHSLKLLLSDRGYSISVGDEGGFAPDFKVTKTAFDFISLAIEKAGYRVGEDIKFALDIAASEIYDSETSIYSLKGENLELDASGLLSYYENLIHNYPIISIEDPFAENDFIGWELMTKKIGKKIQLVGDDLFVTNEKMLKSGIDAGLANAVLIKLNQIGTLTESLNTVKLAQKTNYNTVLSHRSGETEDSTISHVAVATNSGQIKIGSLSRSDRLVKYNELIRIEEMMPNSEYYPLSI